MLLFNNQPKTNFTDKKYVQKQTKFSAAINNMEKEALQMNTEYVLFAI